MHTVMGSGRWVTRAIVVVVVLAVFKCEEEPDLDVVRSINIFERLGVLTNTTRVFPNTNTGWIFIEPTANVFQSPIHARDQNPVLKNDFHVEFCDDTNQLLHAYFHGFSIEGIERPSSAFISTWIKNICSSNLGVDPTFFRDDYSFILVQIARFWTADRMTASEIQQLRLEYELETEVIPGNFSSAQSFFFNHGTHYIESYSTGNALFQVLVFRRSMYQRIKRRFEAEGVTSVTSTELMTYLGPWYTVHAGKILSASGNRMVEAWAARQLKFRFSSFSFPHLFQILIEPPLLRALDGLLGDEALLQLELRSLGQAFADEQRRRWFTEVLDNQLKLWEINQGKECLKSSKSFRVAY